eukprot:TRINITY_DN21355_c0_g1_i1.p1 TRINITY_DN21355_c0_g1~~TRINITY_DN21355_c0_g1_i1.p1  ORF type:complete len:104 (+),score=5.07 TRINITY_DN21355_c0_g1_i1:67-378(+)
MVSPLSKCFAGYALLAACFNASVSSLLPAGTAFSALKGLFIVVAFMKVYFAWATTTLTFKLCSVMFYIRMLRAQAIACSVWISISVVLVVVELFVFGNRSPDL